MLVFVAVRGGCTQAQQDEEVACKARNGCTTCSDFNYNGFPDACSNNARVHCLEIECCPACVKTIYDMFRCEHGIPDDCGDLTCSWPPDSPAPGSSVVFAMRVILLSAAVHCAFFVEE